MVCKWVITPRNTPFTSRLSSSTPCPSRRCLSKIQQRSPRLVICGLRKKTKKGFGKTLNPWVFKPKLRESILFRNLPPPAFPKNLGFKGSHQVTSSCKPSCFNFHICKAAWHQGALDKLAVKVFTSGAAFASSGSHGPSTGPSESCGQLGGIHFFKVHWLVVFHQPIWQKYARQIATLMRIVFFAKRFSCTFCNKRVQIFVKFEYFWLVLEPTHLTTKKTRQIGFIFPNFLGWKFKKIFQTTT